MVTLLVLSIIALGYARGASAYTPPFIPGRTTFVSDDCAQDNCVSCRDVHAANCTRWAQAGECDANPYWMLRHCPESCSDCIARPSLHGDRCLNYQYNCTKWSFYGKRFSNPVHMREQCKASVANWCKGPDQGPGVECQDLNPRSGCIAELCQEMPEEMMVNCRRTCGWCPQDVTGCEDKHELCWQWEEQGECFANPYYMLRICPRSCRKHYDCKCGCVDKDDQCPEWARDDMCYRNPRWMLPNCARSCQEFLNCY